MKYYSPHKQRWMTCTDCGRNQFTENNVCLLRKSDGTTCRGTLKPRVWERP